MVIIDCCKTECTRLREDDNRPRVLFYTSLRLKIKIDRFPISYVLGAPRRSVPFFAADEPDKDRFADFFLLKKPNPSCVQMYNNIRILVILVGMYNA